MFWGGERLKAALPNLVSDYNVSRVDYAAYRLRVGPEVYVSPTGSPEDPRNKPKTLLSNGQGFVIPSGQFGFILTEETVRVPMEAIALISIRANIKFKGLVNVSGFHVDPNYNGPLVFAVYNAGPNEVHLARGDECFLIWYADLDQASQVPEKKGNKTLPSDAIGYVSLGTGSFASLSSKIDENDKALKERITTIEREQAVIKWASALIVGAILTIALRGCTVDRSQNSPNQRPAPAATVQPAVTPAPSSTAVGNRPNARGVH